MATLAGAPARAGGRGQALLTRALAVPPSFIALALAGAAVGVHLVLGGTVGGTVGGTIGGTAAPGAGVAGALLAAVGLAWSVWARALFGAAHTPAGLLATPLQLIEEGPYRVGRNPMYLGMAVVMLGAALGLGVPLLAVGALLFGLIVNAVHIPHEEAQLTRRFGGWYRDYAGARRRWV